MNRETLVAKINSLPITKEYKSYAIRSLDFPEDMIEWLVGKWDNPTSHINDVARQASKKWNVKCTYNHITCLMRFAFDRPKVDKSKAIQKKRQPYAKV